MFVGELLLQRGWIGEVDLALALADLPIAKKRTCSLLVVRGVLEPDHAAMALAELLGCVAALTKHLQNRDRALAKILPANIARHHCALPLGRMRDGEIVLCLRDPKPHSQAAFERLLQAPVLITVAAAHELEPLVEMAYDTIVPPERHGLHLHIPEPPLPPPELAAGTFRAGDGIVDESVDVEISGATSMPELPEEFSLVDLDDAGVSRDFSQVAPIDARGRSTLPPLTTTPTKKP
jgi:hypothetical protein